MKCGGEIFFYKNMIVYYCGQRASSHLSFLVIYKHVFIKYAIMFL